MFKMVAMLAIIVSQAVRAQAAQPVLPEASLPARIDLPRLVDLAAQRLGLAIEYDAAALKGEVTLRLGEAVTDQELWELTNRLLATRGFTTIRVPGSNLISVVRTADAAAAARIEPLAEEWPPAKQAHGPAQEAEQPDADIAPARAGFKTLVLRAQHRPAKDLVAALKPFLTTPGGNAVDLGTGSLIMLSDLGPRLEQMERILALLDTPAAAVRLREVPVRNLTATALAALVAQVATKRESVNGEKVPGEVLASPTGRSLFIVASETEAPFWLGLIEALDQREPVTTEPYTPRYFPVEEVAALVREVVAGPNPAVSGDDRFRLVADELTGTLIITATATQHEQITGLMTRLDSVPDASRHPVRSFKVRNRNVVEVVTLLEDLIRTGVLTPGDGLGDSSDVSGGAPMQAGSSPLLDDLRRTDQPVHIGGPQANAPSSPPNTNNAAPVRPLTPPSVAARGRDRSDRGHNSTTFPSQQPDIPLKLAADVGTSTIIAVGEARLLTQLGKLIEQLDVRQPQVMLEVLTISLSDSDSLSLGVEIAKQLDLSGNVRGTLSSLFGLGSSGTDSPATPTGGGFTGIILSPGDFAVVLRALEIINQGQSLSVPHVLVNNNEQGVLNSVVQQPFASTNASNSTTTTSFGGTLDAGTQATIRPQIAEGDHLVLEYAVSVSSFTGTSASPNLPPPRQENSIQSVVTIPDGFAVALGGLELVTDSTSISQIPGLGNIPILGEAFKNRNLQRSRSRFFVFIRANVLRHSSFEDLKYLSARTGDEAGLTDEQRGWPTVKPRIIR